MSSVLTPPTTMAPRRDPKVDAARLDGADLLRGVAVVGVVAVHAAHWPSTTTPRDAAVWNDLTLVMRFCVPVFVLLTGMLLEFRRDRARSTPSFLLSRARRSVLPWLVWAPVYFVTGLLLTAEIERSAFAAGDWWAGGGGHLYFLLLVPQFYVVFLAWPRRLGTQVALALGLLAMQLTLETLRLTTILPGDAVRQFTLWHGFEIAPFWAGYFGLGVVIGRLAALGRLRPSRGAGIVAALAIVPAGWLLLRVTTGDPGLTDFAQGTGAFLRPLLVPLVVAISLAALLGGPVAFSTQGRTMRTARLLSRHALGIYILQALILYLPGRALFPLLDAGLPWSALGFALLVTAALAMSLAVSALIARTPLAWTIGAPRSAPRHTS